MTTAFWRMLSRTSEIGGIHLAESLEPLTISVMGLGVSALYRLALLLNRWNRLETSLQPLPDKGSGFQRCSTASLELLEQIELFQQFH